MSEKEPKPTTLTEITAAGEDDGSKTEPEPPRQEGESEEGPENPDEPEEVSAEEFLDTMNRNMEIMNGKIDLTLKTLSTIAAGIRVSTVDGLAAGFARAILEHELKRQVDDEEINSEEIAEDAYELALALQAQGRKNFEKEQVAQMESIRQTAMADLKDRSKKIPN